MLNQHCQSNALQQKSTEMVAKPTHWDFYALWTQFTTVNQAKKYAAGFSLNLVYPWSGQHCTISRVRTIVQKPIVR